MTAESEHEACSPPRAAVTSAVTSATADAATLAAQRPWLRHYGAVPAQLRYHGATVYQMIVASAARAPAAIAWDFFDTRASYRPLLAQIDRCAAALATLGLRPGPTPLGKATCGEKVW